MLSMLHNIVLNIRLRDNVAVVDDIPYLQFDVDVRGLKQITDIELSTRIYRVTVSRFPIHAPMKIHTRQ
jgi:hypothetical protein